MRRPAFVRRQGRDELSRAADNDRLALGRFEVRGIGHRRVARRRWPGRIARRNPARSPMPGASGYIRSRLVRSAWSPPWGVRRARKATPRTHVADPLPWSSDNRAGTGSPSACRTADPRNTFEGGNTRRRDVQGVVGLRRPARRGHRSRDPPRGSCAAPRRTGRRHPRPCRSRRLARSGWPTPSSSCVRPAPEPAPMREDSSSSAAFAPGQVELAVRRVGFAPAVVALQVDALARH